MANSITALYRPLLAASFSYSPLILKSFSTFVPSTAKRSDVEKNKESERKVVEAEVREVEVNADKKVTKKEKKNYYLAEFFDDEGNFGKTELSPKNRPGQYNESRVWDCII